MSAGPYSIGSDNWPGLSKLIEECGEVLQIAGKLIATSGELKHWDGSNLADRLVEELGDLSAAIEFVVDTNDIEWSAVSSRWRSKLATFHQWHREQARPVSSPSEPTPPVFDEKGAWDAVAALSDDAFDAWCDTAAGEPTPDGDT